MARNMLGNAKSFVLMNVVKAMYVESKMTDQEFADAFSKGQFVNVDPQFFMVTDDNVAGARKALNIKSNYMARNTAAARTAAQEVLDRLDDIQDKITRIYKYLSEQAKRDL